MYVEQNQFIRKNQLYKDSLVKISWIINREEAQ